MKYSFEDLFDLPKLTQLCEKFTEVNGAVTALLDLDGNVRIQTGWQRICTHFHRVHPTTAARCLESDTALAGALESGERYNVYHCKNGLVDVAIPIYVSGDHVANFFTGQFFLKPPDRSYFEEQGRNQGFRLPLYMDALERVPVFDEDKVRAMATFMASMAEMFGEMAKAKLDLLELRKAEQRQFHALEAAHRELEAAHRELDRVAREDPLTGLKNRRELSSCLDAEFYRARRYGHSLSLSMIDVDSFKSINDKYGHAAGDEVLKSISDVLLSSVRKSDVVARLGGDEFCMLFPESNPDDIVALTHRLCSAITHLRFRAGDESFSISCSFGVTSSTPEHKRPEELLACADRALYEAKESGRNRVVRSERPHLSDQRRDIHTHIRPVMSAVASKLKP